MRITSNDVNAFVTVLSAYINDRAELRLYGSRLDDNKKGGDIDMLLLVGSDELKQLLLFNKPEIYVGIKQKIGDQKIDLLIETHVVAKNDPFIQIILPESLCLYEWCND